VSVFLKKGRDLYATIMVPGGLSSEILLGYIFHKFPWLVGYFAVVYEF